MCNRKRNQDAVYVEQGEDLLHDGIEGNDGAFASESGNQDAVLSALPMGYCRRLPHRGTDSDTAP